MITWLRRLQPPGTRPLRRQLFLHAVGLLAPYVLAIVVFWPAPGEEPNQTVLLVLMFTPTCAAFAPPRFAGGRIRWGRTNWWLRAGLVPTVVVLGAHLASTAFGRVEESSAMLGEFAWLATLSILVAGVVTAAGHVRTGVRRRPPRVAPVASPSPRPWGRPVAEAVSRGDVVAFRLQAHHLCERLGDGGLLAAAGRCAVQNSPPGSALLALGARVRDLTAPQLEHAVGDSRTVLQTWCMRGAPFVFPTVDAPVFTTGVLPPTEESMRRMLPGVVPALERLELRLTDTVGLCRSEIGGVLTGRRLPISALGVELAGRIADQLPPAQRASWCEAGAYAPGQSLGEAVVHFCVRVLTLQGVVCFAARSGNTAPLVLVDEWLGRPVADVEPELARAELLRRYLRGYGPATRAHFAGWLGVAAADAGAWWDLVEDELTPVDFGGRRWVLTADLDALRSPAAATGVRLLPPRDPYTQVGDRETLVDRRYHSKVWRATGGPGVVLAHGTVVGTWRARRTGRTMTIAITSFEALTARDERLLRDEAERVAALRGASPSAVTFGTH